MNKHRAACPTGQRLFFCLDYSTTKHTYKTLMHTLQNILKTPIMHQTHNLASPISLSTYFNRMTILKPLHFSSQFDTIQHVQPPKRDPPNDGAGHANLDIEFPNHSIDFISCSKPTFERQMAHGDHENTHQCAQVPRARDDPGPLSTALLSGLHPR